MSGTEEAVLGGHGSQPAGGSPVLCFGQVSVSPFPLEGMRVSGNQGGLGKQCVSAIMYVSCCFHLEALFGRFC